MFYIQVNFCVGYEGSLAHFFPRGSLGTSATWAIKALLLPLSCFWISVKNQVAGLVGGYFWAPLFCLIDWSSIPAPTSHSLTTHLCVSIWTYTYVDICKQTIFKEDRVIPSTLSFFRMTPAIQVPFCCSVTQSCPPLCEPMDCLMPGFPILHCLPELAQTHVHCTDDAIQPSHPPSSPSPPALNLPQHQGLFQWVRSSHQVAKGLELQLQRHINLGKFLSVFTKRILNLCITLGRMDIVRVLSLNP